MTLIWNFYEELVCFIVSIFKMFVLACSLFFLFFFPFFMYFVFLNILIEDSLDVEETC